MIIKVEYCQHMRKDGSYNCVVFDIEKQQLSNRCGDYYPGEVFVEAHMSCDVNSLRDKLIEEGYVVVERIGDQ